MNTTTPTETTQTLSFDERCRGGQPHAYSAPIEVSGVIHRFCPRCEMSRQTDTHVPVGGAARVTYVYPGAF